MALVIRLAAVAVAFVGCVAVVPGVTGLLIAVGGTVGSWRLFGHLARRDADRERGRLRHDLPVALDLLAAAIAGGASVEGALELVGSAIAGPVGTSFVTVAAMTRLGQPMAEAWTAIDLTSPLGDVRRSLVRSATSGAAVADSIRLLASTQRATARAEAESVVRRASVLAVLPLGLCFLPAFVLLAVVPLVAAVAVRITTGS